MRFNARLKNQSMVRVAERVLGKPVDFEELLPAADLVINGATGIAVGMATNIPPHNLGEVCTALIKLLDNDELGNAQLCRYVKGPDFPTGGQILNSQEELKEIPGGRRQGMVVRVSVARAMSRNAMRALSMGKLLGTNARSL